MIWLILFLGLVLRLVNLNQSFWLDEAIGVIAANEFTYRGLVTEFMKFDNHSPLYYIFLKFWGDSLGYGEVAVRMLSVTFGVLTIGLVYAIAQEINEWVGKKENRWPLVASLFMATAPLHIYYSQEARMYPLAAFVAALSIWLFIRVLRENKFFDWALFSISLIFLVGVDYVPVFLIPVFWLAPFLLKRDFRWFIKLIISHLPLTIIFLAWLPIFAVQSQKGQWLLATLPAWRDVAGGATLKQVALTWIKFSIGRISFFNKINYAAIVAVTSLPIVLGFAISWMKRQKEQGILWLWLVIPLLLGFLASFFIPAFTYFRFLYVLPAFYLLLSWGVVSWERYGKLLGVAILAVNLFGWSIYTTDSSFWREDWREATAFVENKASASEIVLFEFPDPFAPYRWYAAGSIEAAGALTSISAREGETEGRVESLTADKTGVWHFIYLRDLSDPKKLVGATLTDLGFIQKEVYDFRGIGHIVHWAKP